MDVKYENPSSCWSICMASSRVGTITKALMWSSFFLESILWITGSKNAAVLPVPVWAEPIMSFPSIIIGMAFSWMGVGLSKPMAWMPFAKSELKLNSLKFNICLLWLCNN